MSTKEWADMTEAERNAAQEAIMTQVRESMAADAASKAKERATSFFPFPSAEMKHAVFELLKLHSIDHVEIRFDGSGDSGQVEEVNLYRHWGNNPELVEDAALESIAMPYRERNGQTIVNGKWQHIEKIETMPLKKALEQLCYDATEVATEVDWCNNDGGFGVLHLGFDDKGKPTVNLDISQRITSTEDYEFDLSDGGE